MIYDINGTQYSMASLDLELAGYTMIGGSELKMSEKLEPEDVEGQSSVPVGQTRGKWSGEGSLKLPLSEALDAKASIGNEWGTVAWTGTATFTEMNGPGVMTVEILGARFTSTELDGGDRSKASTGTLSFKLTQPSIWNGVKIVEPNSGGGGGFDFAVSFSL
jgi:hypothetical protein